MKTAHVLHTSAVLIYTIAAIFLLLLGPTIYAAGPAQVSQCYIYGEHDLAKTTTTSSQDSQLFFINPSNKSVSSLGPVYSNYDISGVDIDPSTRTLYAVTGSGNSSGKKGWLFKADANNGTLYPVGYTGFSSIEGISFRPSDNSLWLWDESKGLVKVNNLATGQASLVLSSSLGLEALAWNNAGTLLYGTENKKIYEYNPSNNSIRLLTATFTHPVEGMDTRPDGNLVGGYEWSGATAITIFNYNIATGTTVNEVENGTFNEDMEGIAWPSWCGNPYTTPTVTPRPTNTPTRTPTPTLRPTSTPTRTPPPRPGTPTATPRPTATPTPFHLACSGVSCSAIAGAGANACSPQGGSCSQTQNNGTIPGCGNYSVTQSCTCSGPCCPGTCANGLTCGQTRQLSGCVSQAPQSGPVVSSVTQPDGGATVQTRYVSVNWTFNDATGSGCSNAWGYNCGGNSNHFELQIDDDPAFGSPVIDNATLSAASRSYTTAASDGLITTNTTYYARICAINDASAVNKQCSTAKQFKKDPYLSGSFVCTTVGEHETTANPAFTSNGASGSSIQFTMTAAQSSGVTSACTTTTSGTPARVTGCSCTVGLDNVNADPVPSQNITIDAKNYNSQLYDGICL